MNKWFDAWDGVVERLEGLGAWLAPLGLRLVLAWEFHEAGREKLGGSNWFGDIHEQFPFPFDRVSTDLSWALATWTELLAAIALLVGLATRLSAFALLVLTIVATAAVHWPADWSSLAELGQGYAISDDGHGNYKLPLLFAVMLLPLILRGPGKLSIDALLAHRSGRAELNPYTDLVAWGSALLVAGLALAMLMPTFGLAMAAVGLLLAIGGRWLTP